MPLLVLASYQPAKISLLDQNLLKLYQYQLYLTGINNPPSDSANFLYGSGVAINKKKAIKEALVDLSSKLGIHVQSKFQTSTKVTCNGYYETIEKNSEGNIKTEVKDLYISQYKIEEVYTASPIELKFPNNYLW
ncbi:hypothetical protein BMR07_01280 [Methylococcaceae bacterium CS1]|nr:hypothetical protein BMR11_02145 [Methylococcaceae bacterium CS5]TXL08793.1 hypothetical protein BMR07_01280 [Methylococcaceae bacterium CS1]TXL09050.1 hypothetical protein BMR09_02225 [Methylococcaceae bacterium CS3]